jgi:hypothetical protein
MILLVRFDLRLPCTCAYACVYSSQLRLRCSSKQAWYQSTRTDVSGILCCKGLFDDGLLFFCAHRCCRTHCTKTPSIMHTLLLLLDDDVCYFVNVE